jgi:hypothetical protein
VLYSYGTVLWIPQSQFSVLAKKSAATWRTSSTYTTNLVFGSWAFSGQQMNIDFFGGQASMDFSDYKSDDSYRVLENTAVTNEKFYSCCPEPYYDLTFNLKVKTA